MSKNEASAGQELVQYLGGASTTAAVTVELRCQYLTETLQLLY